MSIECVCDRGRNPIVPALLTAGMLVTKPVAADETCASIGRQTNATVIAYEPPASFSIYRAAHVEQDIVVGRSIYVELPCTCTPKCGEIPILPMLSNVLSGYPHDAQLLLAGPIAPTESARVLSAAYASFAA